MYQCLYSPDPEHIQPSREAYPQSWKALPTRYYHSGFKRWSHHDVKPGWCLRMVGNTAKSTNSISMGPLLPLLCCEVCSRIRSNVMCNIKAFDKGTDDSLKYYGQGRQIHIQTLCIPVRIKCCCVQCEREPVQSSCNQVTHWSHWGMISYQKLSVCCGRPGAQWWFLWVKACVAENTPSSLSAEPSGWWQECPRERCWVMLTEVKVKLPSHV